MTLRRSLQKNLGPIFRQIGAPELFGLAQGLATEMFVRGILYKPLNGRVSAGIATHPEAVRDLRPHQQQRTKSATENVDANIQLLFPQSLGFRRLIDVSQGTRYPLRLNYLV